MWMTTVLRLCGLSLFSEGAHWSQRFSIKENSRKNGSTMSLYILLPDTDRVVFVLFVVLSTSNVQIQIMSSEHFRRHFLPGCIYFWPQIISFNLLAFEEMSVLSILPQRNVQTQTKLDHIIITCLRVLPSHEKPNQLLNFFVCACLFVFSQKLLTNNHFLMSFNSLDSNYWKRFVAFKSVRSERIKW